MIVSMDTKKSGSIKNAVIFDTNVFDRIVRKGNESAYDHVIGYLNNKKISPGGFGAFLTPFLFMEYMGISVKKHHPTVTISAGQFTVDVWKYVLDYVFKEASRHFSGLSELQPAFISKQFANKTSYVSSKATALFGDIVAGIVSGGNHSIIALQLALDYAYGFNLNSVPGIKDQDIEMIHLNAMVDLFRVDQHKKNVSVARGAFNATDYLATKKSSQIIPADLELLKRGKQGLKLKGDLGDLDLIHLAVVGAYLNDVKYPVIAFTADPEDSVKGRLKAYKEFVSTLRNVVLSLNQPDWRSMAAGFAALPGEVVVLSTDCTKTICVIDVSSL
jgi:hypothetical protein